MKHIAFCCTSIILLTSTLSAQSGVGDETSLPTRLVDGQEFALDIEALFDHGRDVFAAN